MSLRNLFDKIPSSLFSPLAAQNAPFYSEVLLALFTETQHHQEPLSRELSITIIIEILEEVGEIDALPEIIEEQSSIETEDVSDARRKAGAVLRYLVRHKWLNEEIQNDFSLAYTLPDYAFRILSIFNELSSKSKIPLQGLIYTIHDLLQAAVRDGDEPMRIDQAHRETMRLINALKELQHNIGIHIEEILQQTEPKEVLEQAFGVYLHDATRHAYHDLRTTDHVSRFRRDIKAALTQLSVRDHLSVKEEENGRRGKARINQYGQNTLEQIQNIGDQFDALDDILYTIDSRHSQFFESAIRSIEHTLLANSTTSGHLHTILSFLLDPRMHKQDSDESESFLSREMDQLLTYHTLSLIDERSLAPMRHTREVFVPDLQDTAPLTDDEIAAAREETLAQMFRAVSRVRVKNFAHDLLREQDERYAKDFPISHVDDLPLLIYLKVYGDGSLGYIFEHLEDAEKIERGSIGFRNFRIRRSPIKESIV